ncbi:hypothetical protein V495_00949 [Pseudogymnoascus sp. VKM F-4514 (FW-929)]|nr:hypothetical protein V495_00949 [Pseudogymnoascus sp. VKM F-4514 (FW-929)]KFY64923.1 hypothetical protein V497_01567 [Pseudogymnoascus sp. VKM F-4516 (FW-969)]
MCVTTNIVHAVCQHKFIATSDCFAKRHPSIPFLRCRPTTELDAPDTLCPSCVAIFDEAEISEYAATRLVAQWRRRENHSGVLIPRLGPYEIRMMDRFGAICGHPIPRGTRWNEMADQAELAAMRSPRMSERERQWEARRRDRNRNRDRDEDEDDEEEQEVDMMATIHPGQDFPIVTNWSARRTARDDYSRNRNRNRHSSMF